MATWPDTLPKPLLAGYSGSPDQAFLRTDFDSGPARQRQRFTDAREKVNASWILTSAQMSIFKAFWRNEIGQGADYFTMSTDIGEGMQNYNVRFTAPYNYSAMQRQHWQVSGALEIRPSDA